MRFKVTMMRCNIEFDEVVIADNKKHAKAIALKNNPNTDILNVEWTFKI